MGASVLRRNLALDPVAASDPRSLLCAALFLYVLLSLVDFFDILAMLGHHVVKVTHLLAQFSRLSCYDSKTFLALADHVVGVLRDQDV